MRLSQLLHAPKMISSTSDHAVFPEHLGRDRPYVTVHPNAVLLPKWKPSLDGTSPAASAVAALRQPTWEVSNKLPAAAVVGLPLAPGLVRKSREVGETIFSVWSNPDAAVVYNFDTELDDQKRGERVAVHYQKTPVAGHLDGEERAVRAIHQWAKSAPAGRPRMIWLAGERDGDTYDELLGVAKLVLGMEPTFQDNDKGVTTFGEFVLLRGGALREEEGNPKEKVTHAAAENLKEYLGERAYVFHNNTSQVLFDAMGEETRKNCLAHVFTCSAITAKGKLVDGANYRFAPQAYDRVFEWCEKNNVPFVSAHGSSAGFTIENLAQIPGWENVMLSAVSNPGRMRAMSRFSMQQVVQWSARLYGAVNGKKEGDVVTDVKARLDAAILQEFGKDEPESLKAWTKKPCNVKQYSEEDCRLDNARIRARSVAENIKCPVTNTLGDFGAVFEGNAMPEDMLLLPVDVAFSQEAKPKGRIPGTVHVGDAKSNHYILANASQESMLAGYYEMVEAIDKVQKDTGMVPEEHVVDVQLAREWRAFANVVRGLLQPVMDATTVPGGNTHLASTQEHVQRALDFLDDGPVTTACARVGISL